jgi:hypothetical protein
MRFAAFRPTLPSWKGSCVVRQCFARSWWRQLPDRRIRLQRLVLQTISRIFVGIHVGLDVPQRCLGPAPSPCVQPATSAKFSSLGSALGTSKLGSGSSSLSSASPSRLDRVLSEPGALLGAPSNADLLDSFECRVTNGDVCCSQLDRVLNGYLRALPPRSTAPQ